MPTLEERDLIERGYYHFREFKDKDFENISNISESFKINAKNMNQKSVDNYIEQIRKLNMLQIKLQKLHNEAIIPCKAHDADAAYDLFSLESGYIYPLQRRLFKTGIAMHIPEGYYGRIAERSGLALKQGLMICGGVIDSGYLNDIGIICYNSDNVVEIEIKKGQKIAQIIFEKCHNVNFTLVDKLEETERGGKGYGSSGN